MNIYMQLSAIAVMPVIASVLVYLLQKNTAFNKLNKDVQQIVIGIIFGCIAILGTEFGVSINGATINARDAAPLCAGLIFGAPAGIIAGLIGGIERWFAVCWGAGTYTQVACSVSTVLAGLFAALLRVKLFDDKKPSPMYALGIGMVTEILHMLMIFLTNMSDVERAFTFVEKCSLPMIVVNSLSVMFAVVAVRIYAKEGIKRRNGYRQIAEMIQRWLFIDIVIAFIITNAFIIAVQSTLSSHDSTNLLILNITDVETDISDASDRNLLSLTHTVRDEYYLTGDIVSIASEYGIAEIDIINNEGIITASTNSSFLGFDMASGEQSAAFLVLNNGITDFVQSYQPISYDDSISRKYAGTALKGGGFLQVGYDAKQFQKDIDNEVIGLTKNRHIGKTGSMIIADEHGIIVSGTNGSDGSTLQSVGIYIDAESITPLTRFNADVFDVESYCMYAVNEGYYIISVLPVSEAVFSRNLSIYVTFFMEIIVFTSLFIIIYFLIKKLVVDNIRKVNYSLGEITGGNLNVVVDVRENEEFASLSDDINSTVITLKNYIAEAAARIDKELEFARSIQYSVLPSVFPPFPDHTEFDIYAAMATAKEVGGDFYDFYLIRDNTLAFMIADVSGKGIPAAMFMMTAKTMIKSYAETGMDVNDALTLTNKKLCEENDAQMFVTCWFGYLDITTGKVTYCNAGHNPPIIRHKGEHSEYLKMKPGFVLAGMDSVVYQKSEFQLAPGDEIFLYTDGVTEATNKKEQLYGEIRLLQIIDKTVNTDSKSLCTAVKADVDAFVGGAPQFDDITMLSLKYKGVSEDDAIDD